MKETLAQQALASLMAAAWQQDHETGTQTPQVKSTFRSETLLIPQGGF
jgi:hypothetical protein